MEKQAQIVYGERTLDIKGAVALISQSVLLIIRI